MSGAPESTGARVASRYARINEVLHAAADSGEEDLRELWETEEDQRLTGARFWIEVLTGKGPLRPGLSHSDAVDVMWLLMSPDNHYRLVHRRRWTTQKYQRWLAASLTELLPACGARPEQPSRAPGPVALPSRAGGGSEECGDPVTAVSGQALRTGPGPPDVRCRAGRSRC